MKISVALCTYNGEKYLKEQLESILSQTVVPDEIVVCDDVSQDSTFDILLKFKNQYRDIFKIERNTENLGYVKNFEKAIMLCSGDLIFLSDQDDVWFENKVEVVNTFFEKNNHIDVLCHNFKLLTDEKLPSTNYWQMRMLNKDASNQQILENTILQGNIFPGMAMVISKKAKEKNLPFKKINRLVIHDFELIIQSSKMNTLHLCSDVLGQYRLHHGQNIGFDTEVKTNEITPMSLHLNNENLKHITEVVISFSLDESLIESYKHYIFKNFQKYISTFPWWKVWLVKLKFKYYYNINVYK